MNLTDNIDTIIIYPRGGYDAMEDRIRAEVISKGGAYTVKEFGNKGQWSIPLNAITSHDAIHINTWWESITKLTLYFASSHVHNVILINEQEPLQMMFGTGWDNKYEGTLLLREL